MQVSFDTAVPNEVQMVIAILAAMGKTVAPVPAPAAATPLPPIPAAGPLLVGFPAGSAGHYGNALGTMPSVTTPDGRTLPAMVQTYPDGSIALVPYVAPARSPETPETLGAEAAGAALQASIQGGNS